MSRHGFCRIFPRLQIWVRRGGAQSFARCQITVIAAKARGFLPFRGPTPMDERKRPALFWLAPEKFDMALRNRLERGKCLALHEPRAFDVESMLEASCPLRTCPLPIEADLISRNELLLCGTFEKPLRCKRSSGASWPNVANEISL